MPAFAITDMMTLKTLYVGIHIDERSTMEIYLGYPSAEEIRDAYLRVICEEVDLYPKAQRCRIL